MKKLVKVDKEVCIGCGVCIATCPEVFEMGDDGKATVKDSEKCKELKCCEEAAQNCPVGAIKLD